MNKEEMFEKMYYDVRDQCDMFAKKYRDLKKEFSKVYTENIRLRRQLDASMKRRKELMEDNKALKEDYIKKG